jgi:hypothetical protein
MKSYKGKAAVLLLFFALPSLFADDWTSLREAEGALSDMFKVIAESLTFNSTLGLNWSDAYIGQILNKPPAKLLNKPPHFGIGVSAGATTINKNDVFSALESAGLDTADLDIPLIPLPSGGGELRLGGFVLPFDIGVKVNVIPSLEIGVTNFSYTMAGFDFRYALLKEENKTWKPTISAGGGFNYIKGNLGFSLGGSTNWDFVDFTGTRQEIKMSAPNVDIDWRNATMDFKAQISKRLLYVFTPYLGLGTSFGWSTVGYGISSNMWYNGRPFDAAAAQEIANYLAAAGIPLDLTGTGFSSEEKAFTFGLRTFGGIAFNIWVIRLDITALYSFLDKNYGASVGLRVQI